MMPVSGMGDQRRGMIEVFQITPIGQKYGAKQSI
jgi:hypothetical protein